MFKFNLKLWLMTLVGFFFFCTGTFYGGRLKRVIALLIATR